MRLIFAILLFSCLNSFGQYRNIVVKEKVHAIDTTYNGCYVVIEDILIDTSKELVARYFVSAYSSKDAWLKSQKAIEVKEIRPTYTTKINTYTNGDLSTAVSRELKILLLEDNDTWKFPNIIVEL